MITTDSHVYFYSIADIYSNFYPCMFDERIDRNSFFNTEQAFMFYKAKFFWDVNSMRFIALEPDPSKVKQLGRQVENFDSVAWGCVSYGFMVYVNYLKFSQNKGLGDQLKATGDRILVEASPSDLIWGCGRGLNDPELLDSTKWTGKNLLGKALMEVRSKL